jgi:hypothetical protein
MKKLFLALLLTACAPTKYVIDNNITQQQRDEAACDVIASNARNNMFPNNPFLNMDAYGNSFSNCMKSKGYSSR